MNTQHNILTLSNFSCAYNAGKEVLRINKLEIPSSKLIFIVGVSGGGKSTFLESVGLMNNTIQKGSSVFFFGESGEKTALKDLWSQEAAIDAFRKKHYSFIFQKTNLMPNFSCGENMLFPALFKGQNLESIKEKIIQYMDLLGLPNSIYDKHTSEISGGQQQRVAFIRAMVADFSILFADEPTGNLDLHTAQQVMLGLKSFLTNTTKTGIVVSHDIDLAAQFADIILPITMKTENGESFGIIEESNILSRADRQWFKSSTAVVDIELELKKLIQS